MTELGQWLARRETRFRQVHYKQECATFNPKVEIDDMTYDVYAKISKKLYAGNPVEVSALSNPRSRGFARARHAAALILLGGCLLGSNPARADEVAPTINLSQSQFTLYQNGLSSYNQRCNILSQAADGAFSCTTDSGKPLAGKIVGVTNTLGQVVAHKISFTLQVSSTVSESFTGAAKVISSAGAVNVFIAGTYAHKVTKYYRLSNGTTMPVTTVTDPLPFAGNAWLYTIAG
jgi:hypothetical protein